MHDLGDGGQVEITAGLLEQVEPLATEALERVG